MILLSQDMATKARVAAELLISLANALWAVKGMVPAAVAIAPALLRGSLTVKQLIPQSTIPGMFVILLPWLYCPLGERSGGAKRRSEAEERSDDGEN